MLGIGGGVASALKQLPNHDSLVAIINIFSIMQSAGNVVFANLGLIFAISIAFGFAKASKGVAALSGFITFIVMTSVISGMFFWNPKTGMLGFDPWGLGEGAKITPESGKSSFNYVEKYGWPKIIHQFTLKILFLIKNLLKVTLFSVKIL